MCALDKEQDVRTSEGGEQKRPLLPMKGGAGDEDDDGDDDDDDGDDDGKLFGGIYHHLDDS